MPSVFLEVPSVLLEVLKTKIMCGHGIVRYFDECQVFYVLCDTEDRDENHNIFLCLPLGSA